MSLGQIKDRFQLHVENVGSILQVDFANLHVCRLLANRANIVKYKDIYKPNVICGPAELLTKSL